PGKGRYAIYFRLNERAVAKSSVNLQFLGTTDEFCRLSPGILIDKIDISGKIVTADAMSMQKDIIKKNQEERWRFSHRAQGQPTFTALRSGRQAQRA
ncbi:hypothetical protein, partial [Duncaniella muris]|uniref:hypothetical protein n=1 Tax=Duncaniella muris TaxID=2094150 RepID=UPI0025AA16E4